MRFWLTVTTALISMAGWCNSAVAKEKLSVTISYVVGPQQPLPEGLHAVAVINSGVSTQGVKQDEREAKWSLMAADMIEAMLQAGSGMMKTPLAVAKRSETQAVLREHDMALAGMIAGSQAAEAGKLLAVQGLITSRITINIDEQRGKKSTIDWMSIMGGLARESVSGKVEPAPPPPVPGHAEVRRGPDGRLYTVKRHPAGVVYDPRVRRHYQQEQTVGGGGLAFQTKEVEEISRHLTVQCSFTLIDAASGQAILQYSTPPVRKYDRQSPDFLFGSVMGVKELDPVDHFIGELVEQSTREFVSMIVPVQMNATYELVAKHSVAEDGLRALRADDYVAAMENFEKDLRKHSDEDSTMFCMGVLSELMGKYDQALQYYRRALSAKDVDKDDLVVYAAAKDRLTRHMGRILPPASQMSNQQPSTPHVPVSSPPLVAPGAESTPDTPPQPTVEETTINNK